MSTSPIELDQVRRAVRSIYVDRRRSLFPNYNPAKSRYDTVWTRAAEWCLNSGVSPEDLVRIAFETYSPYPQPNHLLSQEVRRRLTTSADAYIAKTTQDDELRLRIELNIVAMRTQYGVTFRQLIEDENTDISFLFRYSLSIRAGLTDIAMRMRDQALLELKFYTPRYINLLFKGIEQWVE